MLEQIRLKDRELASMSSWAPFATGHHARIRRVLKDVDTQSAQAKTLLRRLHTTRLVLCLAGGMIAIYFLRLLA